MIGGGPGSFVGSHAHNLVRFITGLEIAEVAAEAGSILPGRVVQDYAGALLRFDNGARGTLWVTQAAAGVENYLRIRASGAKGSLEWVQELPQILTFKPLHAPPKKGLPTVDGYPADTKYDRSLLLKPTGRQGLHCRHFGSAILTNQDQSGYNL
jgi:predicted dehydrogenase